MFKRFVFIVFMIWGCLAWARPAAGWGVVEDGLDKIYDHSRVITDLASFRSNLREGAVFEYYANGDVKRLRHYQAGQLHGSDKIFYEDGQLSSRREFRHGKLHGKARQYYPNGNLRSEVNYIEGMRHGEARYYEGDGTLKLVAIYQADQVRTIKH